MDPQELLVIVLVFGGVGYLLVPIARALAKRIAGDVPSRRLDDETTEAMLSELRELRQEVTSLAERVDFTERLLARQREDRLAPPRRGEGS